MILQIIRSSMRWGLIFHSDDKADLPKENENACDFACTCFGGFISYKHQMNCAV